MAGMENKKRGLACKKRREYLILACLALVADVSARVALLALLKCRPHQRAEAARGIARGQRG